MRDEQTPQDVCGEAKALPIWVVRVISMEFLRSFLVSQTSLSGETTGGVANVGCFLTRQRPYNSEQHIQLQSSLPQ